MRLQDDSDLRLSATDLAHHLACHHLTRLEVLHAHGELEPDTWSSPVVEAIAERGDEHERRYLEHLREDGVRILDLAGAGDHARRAEATKLAMEIGTEAIVQAVLTDGKWLGIADVLRRVERPSYLGGWSYEVHDTKLARETAGGTILQLCLYSELVEEIQGKRPEWMHVVPPGRRSGREFEPVSYRLADYFAYYRHVKERLLDFVGGGAPEETPTTYPEPVPHCQICRWWKRCDRQWRQDDHLSLVAGISKLQIEELRERDVERLEQLAKVELPLSWKPGRGSAETYERVREQARLQVETREHQELVYELLPLDPTAEEDGGEEEDEAAPRPEPRGLARLPEPSPLDVFFDIEGDHFAAEGGREYLFGWAYRDADGEVAYDRLWALESADGGSDGGSAEREMFERFIGEMMRRREEDPSFHIYHFAPYEPAALKRLMGRYATCAEELDELLRAERFVDLYSVVRQAIVAGVESYSIKHLEPLYGFQREENLLRVTENLVRVERALEMGHVEDLPPGVLEIVERYNRDDCVSTLRLRDWLEARRSELVEDGESIPRPEPKDGEGPEELTERQAEIRRLRDELLAEVPVASSEWTEEHESWREEEKATWRLAHMLEFHQRENKASWWEYYRLA
ncbi:MAG: TM0106 family RecB-like putative nuclease, partial [Thermoanaerobaculia bacterium]|nr:TM0106 family RecB-like putative nuclease [Thermoanaerobaculia bacterium]